MQKESESRYSGLKHGIVIATSVVKAKVTNHQISKPLNKADVEAFVLIDTMLY